MQEISAFDSNVWVGSERPGVAGPTNLFIPRLFLKVFLEVFFVGVPAIDFSRVGVADVGNHEEIESSKRILSSLSISKPGVSGENSLCADSVVSREELKSNDFGALPIVGEPREKANWRTSLPLRRGRAVGEIGVSWIRDCGEPGVDESDGGVSNRELFRWSRPRGVDGGLGSAVGAVVSAGPLGYDSERMSFFSFFLREVGAIKSVSGACGQLRKCLFGTSKGEEDKSCVFLRVAMTTQLGETY